MLLIEREFTTWSQARNRSYSAQLAIEEGLHANGVQYLTITTPWLGRAREMCAGKQFDQVWLEIVNQESRDEIWLQWVADLAPVRVGFLPESLEYSPEEYAAWSGLRERKQRVERRLKYMTHVVACDEKDVAELNGRGSLPAMWWPQAVPERFICEQAVTVPNNSAVFCGVVYGERVHWLEHPALKGLLVALPSPEEPTIYPAFFDTLHLAVRAFLKSRLPGCQGILSLYLHCLRRIRRKCFALWLEALQTGSAVVNLPHFVKTYAGRVVEGMAAGRPVISWEIPDRPQNKALFEDGQEILLYPRNDPVQLAAQIRRLLSEPALRQRMVVNARRKLRRFHTVEKRVRQILDWVATGETPVYA